MTSWLSRPIRSLRETMKFGDTPQQLALGVALGLVIGLVPKGNFMCVGLCLIAVSTRVNLGATMLSAVVFSLASPLLDPLTHRIGLKLLTWELLQPVYAVLYSVPFVAWTAFNDTVVIGSLLLGLGASAPTYWIAKRSFTHSAERAAARRPLAASTSSHSYVAATSPLAMAESEEAFQANVAMAAPANLDDLEESRDPESSARPDATRRLESAHGAPAPLANNYSSSESTTHS